MRDKTVEISVGLFVIIALLSFAFLALRVSGLVVNTGNQGYHVTARFDNIGDLKIRAPVNISGVRVGRVTGIALDPMTFEAIVTMTLNADQHQIPNDTAASIFTQGLLGSNYISLTPGVDDHFLQEGSKITQTHPALILENLIGQFLFNTKKEKT